jgi:serine/threonine-protein kinase
MDPSSAPPGYEVVGELGRGGMGVVYRARHRALGRSVALKVVLGAELAGDEALERFRAEARTVAQLQHEGVVQVFEVGEHGGLPFMALELVEGGTLADRLAGEPQPPREAAALVARLARAVQHAHDRGIVHRDLKPANVLLASPGGEARYGTPKVSDFGLAKLLGADARLTRTGDVLGSPSYMAPEQARGDPSAIGPLTDVYALGAILYECLTGRPPFRGADAVQTIVHVVTAEPVAPRALVPQVPIDLETVAMRCLSKEPAKRYPSAAALAEDLERFLAGEPIRARPVSRPERLVKWARRRPWQATAAGLALLLVAAGAVGYLLLRASYRDVVERKEEADRVVALALDDLERLTFATSERLYEVPMAETLRRDLLEAARTSLEGLSRIRPRERRVRRHLVSGYDALANAEMKLGRLDAALAAQKRAYEAASALAEEVPGDRDATLRRAVMASRLAILHARAGDTEQAAAFDRETEEGVARLLAEDPGALDALELSGYVLKRRYGRALERGDHASAEGALRELIASRRRMAAADPGNRDRLLDVADEQMLLASWLASRGRTDEALAEAESAEAAVRDHPERGTLRIRRMEAWVHWTQGDVLAARKEPERADKAYRAARDVYAALAEQFPSTREHRVNQALMSWYLARLWVQAGHPARAQPDLAHAKNLLEGLARDGGQDAQSRDLLASVEEMLRAPADR